MLTQRDHEPFPILPSSNEVKPKRDPHHSIADTPNQPWFQGAIPPPPPPIAPSPEIAHPNLTLRDSCTSPHQQIPSPPVSAEYTGTVLKRLSSTRIPDDHTGLKIEELAPMLDRELSGCRKWDDSGLIKSVFPKLVGNVKVSQISFIK